MAVTGAASVAASGASARTRRLMLNTAVGLMRGGETPSVSEAAEAAGVSRATAYRYFPSQAALVHAVVDEALGPILSWSSRSTDPESRVVELLDFSMPRIIEFEATFKIALKLSLDQWARGRSGKLGDEPEFKRGHRIELIHDATRPLEATLSKARFKRLNQALSLVFGLEAVVVLKDLCDLDTEEMQKVVVWAARALVRTAVAEAAG